MAFHVKAQAPKMGSTTMRYTSADVVSRICKAVSLSTASSRMPQAHSTASLPQPNTAARAPRRPMIGSPVTVVSADR